MNLRSSRCELCPLKGQGPYVEGEGAGQRVIIIGEAPGREERQRRRPFVGRSGQVLRGVLNQLSLKPEDIRITNVVKCRPPDNRTPTREEIERCLPHLYEEIRSSPGAKLLLLGNTPLHYLTDCKDGITRARGEWLPAWDGRDALATFHPAYIARPTGEEHFDDFVLDIQRALSGPIGFKETEWELLYTAEKVADYLKQLMQAPEPIITAWDLETSGYRFYQDYILAMAISHVKGRGWVITEELMHDEEVHELLRQAFVHPNIRWIGHNAKFDQIFTLQHIGDYPRLFADTMMMHLALDERKGTHDLKTLCRDLCGAPDWESVLWQYLDNREDTYAKVPRNVLYKYAAYDVDYTLRLYEIFDKQLEEDGTRILHDELLLPASEAMMWAEFGGVSVDLDDVDAWQWRLEQELEKDEEDLSQSVSKTVRHVINRTLDELGLTQEQFWKRELKKPKISWDKSSNRYQLTSESVDGRLADLLCWRAKLVEQGFSAGSWQKVGTLAYEVLGLEYLAGKDVRTRGQEYSTSSASLEPYAQEYEVINRVLGYRTKKKLLSTYVDGLAPDPDGRIHPRWKMHATVTGRIGCTDPNVMNIPHEAGTRDFFIASPDHVLVQADYSQAELRILASYAAQHQISQLITNGDCFPEEAKAVAEDGFLVRCYREGRDLHTEVTVALYGEKWGYDERMIAKAFNFGLVYGRSAKSIAEAFDIPLSEAQKRQTEFFDRMPEVQTYLRYLENQVAEAGELQNCFGRKRRFHFVDSMNVGDLERQAKNFMMQSTASDCCLKSTSLVSEWFRKLGWGRVLVFLHDSVMVEVPESAMTIAARKLHEILTYIPHKYLGDIVALKVDMSVGYAWGSLKDFDPVKGEIINGK